MASRAEGQRRRHQRESELGSESEPAFNFSNITVRPTLHGERALQESGSRPAAERMKMRRFAWECTVLSLDTAGIIDAAEEELPGVGWETLRPYVEESRRRLEKLQDVTEVELWTRQVARLEDGCENAWRDRNYVGQAALEEKLIKVAGTAAPERFIHLAQVQVVDVRAVEIDEELRKIRESVDGPQAIAHQITELGVQNPEDLSSQKNAPNSVRPATEHGPAEPVLGRAHRGSPKWKQAFAAINATKRKL